MQTQHLEESSRALLMRMTLPDMAQTVTNPPATWETWIRSLSWEGPVEEGTVTHASTLVWRIPMGRGAWGAPVHRVAKGGTRLSSKAQRKNVINARASQAAQLVDPACRAGDPGSIPGSGRSPGEGTGYPLQYSWVSLVAQMVKNLPAVWEAWV